MDVRKYNHFYFSYDPLASAFFSVVTNLNNTEKKAVNDLISGVRANGLQSKIYALHPMVGGTSLSCSYNLMNTAQYQITWNGGWTFASTGATSNGTNAYGDTGINVNAFGSGQNNHMGVYSRTSGTGRYDFSATSSIGGIGNPYIIICNYVFNGNAYYVSGDSASSCNIAVSDGLGLTIGASSGTTQNLYRNSGLIKSSTGALNTATSNSLYLGANNGNGTAEFFSAREYSLVTVGTYLSATEIATYNTLITNFQTTLGRNV